jgi:hypothetical protein
MYNVTFYVQGALVFSSYDGGLQATEEYAGRISLVSADTSYGKGSVNLTNIRESDGGWYECSVFFPNRTPSTRPNGTWFHLSVEGNRVRVSHHSHLRSFLAERLTYRARVAVRGCRIVNIIRKVPSSNFRPETYPELGLSWLS